MLIHGSHVSGDGECPLDICDSWVYRLQQSGRYSGDHKVCEIWKPSSSNFDEYPKK